jgi:hypothetical protein
MPVLESPKYGPQINQQWCRQISSMMKFAEQNLHYPIVDWNLYRRYP